MSDKIVRVSRVSTQNIILGWSGRTLISKSYQGSGVSGPRPLLGSRKQERNRAVFCNPQSPYYSDVRP